MTYRISVSSKVDDGRARVFLRTLQNAFPKSGLTATSFVQVYAIDAELTPEQAQEAAERFTDPLIESYGIGEIPLPREYTFAIEIGFLPGVTDNVGHTAREMIEDLTGRTFVQGEDVYTSGVLFLRGEVSAREAEGFARELHNPLIERASVFARGDMIPLVVPKVRLGQTPAADIVDLEVSDAVLMRISKEGIAGRGPLALPLASMRAIRDHFKRLGRKPTDIELESLAQTWSEHCKHTIFADPIDEVREGIYRRYIKGATKKIRKMKGRKDFCASVFTDNAGAIAFDKDYLVTHKVETHNSPSGLDPFGGSVTAIVGVNRDCLGFGLGAKPIANTYGFCVGNPLDQREFYRDESRTKSLLPARRILEGVVKGINVGGNQSGIPTPLGFIVVDDSYRGKPLVFGGTVGLIPRRLPRTALGSKKKIALGKRAYEKRARPGDLVVMLGGRVGLDGIHGATFSSVELSKGSPATAVQIGDPITQKKFSDALVREARDRALYTSITDNGAGGLSGSVGEMARESGGCEIALEQVPLKYPGLAPWQIWLSESQERMTLAVPAKKWPELKALFESRDVEATAIGRFTDSGRVVVRHHDKIVLDLSLDFLHDGRPVHKQKSKKPRKGKMRRAPQAPAASFGNSLLKLLACPSVGSTSFVAQQYDHEVLGSSVTKPLQGRGLVNADAAVIEPLASSAKGVVLSHGYAPWYSQLDTYAMAAASIDTAVRNAVCAGAHRDHLAILDNFCWSSSDTPERLYELKEAARACYDTAVAHGVPFISGKDSMFNDFRGFGAQGDAVHIAALPTLLISAIGVMPDASKAMTLDFKRPGDLLYLVGETHDELGASAYYAVRDARGGVVPQVFARKNAKAYDALTKAIDAGLVASAIGLSRGGLSVALAKSSIAGQLGARIDITKAAKKLPAEAFLFSESQGRMLVSVRPDACKRFEQRFKGVPFARIGEVVAEPMFSVTHSEGSIELPLAALADAYRSFFKNW